MIAWAYRIRDFTDAYLPYEALDFSSHCVDFARSFIMIGLAALVAAKAPWATCSDCGAPLWPELMVFWGVIPVIFVCEGLSLAADEIVAAARRVGTHSAVLAFNFGFMPLSVLGICQGLAALGFGPASLYLFDGFLALAALPTTTSMCVMLVTRAGGNAPLAAFGALLSNILGFGHAEIAPKSRCLDAETVLVAHLGRSE